MTITRAERSAQARVLREQGFKYREIGERMGISRGAAYDLIVDPDGSRARTRRAKNDGVCMDCEARTKSGGGRVPPKRCHKCSKRFQEENARWTPDEIVRAIRAWVVEHGRAPSPSKDWLCAGVDHPTATTVVAKVGWAEALRRADCQPRVWGPGASGGPYKLTPTILAETVDAYERTGSYAAAGRVLGITTCAVRERLRKANHPPKPRSTNPRRQVADRETDRLNGHLARLRAEIIEVEGQIRKWETVRSTLRSIVQERRYTEKAPCEHCSAGHDEVLVIAPGQTPPSIETVERDGWPTVEDFDWPEETYADA